MKRIIKFATLSIAMIALFASCATDEPGATKSKTRQTDEPMGSEWIDPIFAKLLVQYGIIENADTIVPSDVADIKEIRMHVDMSKYTMPGQGFRSALRSLRGIEYFTSLECFDVDWDVTNVMDIDLSNNKNLKFVRIFWEPHTKNINVSENTNLETLILNCPFLEVLNTTGCTNLKTLEISHANSLSSLDLSTNTSLEKVEITVGNEIRVVSDVKSIDLSDCNNIQSIKIKYIPFETLNLGNTENLTKLIISNSKIKELDLSGCKNLSEIEICNTKLEELDLSACKKLKYNISICNNENLKKLVLPKNATNIKCLGNSLLELNLSDFSELVSIDCSSNRLVSLDLPKKIYRGDNEDVKYNLKEVLCQNNLLEELDLTQCPSLEVLNCSNNRLQSLDISVNAVLNVLDYSKNPGLNGVFSLLK